MFDVSGEQNHIFVTEQPGDAPPLKQKRGDCLRKYTLHFYERKTRRRASITNMTEFIFVEIKRDTAPPNTCLKLVVIFCMQEQLNGAPPYKNKSLSFAEINTAFV